MNHPGNVHSRKRGNMREGDCDEFMLVYMKRKYYERDLAYLNMIDSFTQVPIHWHCLRSAHVVTWCSGRAPAAAPGPLAADQAQ